MLIMHVHVHLVECNPGQISALKLMYHLGTVAAIKMDTDQIDSELTLFPENRNFALHCHQLSKI